MTVSIKILRGDEAHKTRCLCEFIDQWDSLAKQTNHVSIFQESVFVNRWYEQYSSQYEPVLVLGYNQDMNLIGFIPLAIDIPTKKLSHAADQQAEYSGWLAHPNYEQQFLNQAIAAVYNQIPHSSWHWSHIPPRADTNWVQTPPPELRSVHLHFEQEKSPILDLDDVEKIKKIKKNKSIKSKINRLKRKGDLHMEHITNQNRAKEVMQRIPDLVNFRHGAAHGNLAFKEDPFQQNFYLSRTDNLSNNHFSALWMGDTLLAFHFGCIDEDTLYIGLTAFDPRESKHSPGVIFILFLAEMMKEQGIRYIDLTPGGDEYKERFCNGHHTLLRPIIYSSGLEKIKNLSIRKSKQMIFSGLSLLGIDKNSLTKKLDTLKNQSGHEQDFHLFNLDLINNRAVAKDEATIIHIQEYNDLLIHQGYANCIE